MLKVSKLNFDRDIRLERLVGLGWLQLANLAPNVTSYSNVDLPCGQEYDYRLLTYNAGGSSDYATTSLSTPACEYQVFRHVIYLPTVRRR
jgi:hypothetical protein